MVYEPREIIFLDFTVLINLLKNLKYFKVKIKLPIFQIFKNIKRNLEYIYYLSVLKTIKPRIIITLIDNSGLVSWLTSKVLGIEFIVIQNGTRTINELNKTLFNLHLENYYCFGEYEKTLFSNYNYKIKNFHPVGSLLAGYYWPKNKIDIKYDICIVSCWRGNIENTPDVSLTMEAMGKLDKLLSKYIDEKRLKAVVALRSEPDSLDRKMTKYGDEKEYFKNHYGSSIALIDPNLELRNIYEIMSESSIIISFGSTAPREAFGLGKKILYSDFTLLNEHNDYNSSILFKEENYKKLCERLDNLISCPQEEYEKKMKSYASYLMNLDKDNPPHLILKKHVDNILSNKN